MTPLAHRIVKELTLPTSRRTLEDGAGILSKMAGIHCFEVSAVMDMAWALAYEIPKHGADQRSTFLPAPNTWIEWETERETFFDYGKSRKYQIRQGLLLRETNGGIVIDFAEAEPPQPPVDDWEPAFYSQCGGDRGGPDGLGDMPCPARLQLRYEPPLAVLARPVDYYCAPPNLILAFLAFINTPRIVGRRQHMPHRGLERALTKARPMVGKFPLHAWTEIKLEVSPPKDASGDSSAEAHLTGQRALHFCRAHLRVRLGRLEVVRSHWRGDPALGIKQSRYRLTQPRAA